MNYQNEYDRIRNEIQQSVIKGQSVSSLKDRRDHLQKLGAKVIDGIVD